MNDLKPLVLEILDNSYLMSLSTCADNKPWTCDLVFVYSNNFEIFWLSKSITRHSTNILNNPNVSATITLSCNQGEDNKGLQIEGKSFLVKGLLPEMAIKHLNKRKKHLDDFKNILKIRDERWYKLVQDNIELIYEPLFGFERRKFK